MEQLKQPNEIGEITAIALFTFHYGAIKTKISTRTMLEQVPFTFHYGAIKTYVTFACNRNYDPFTFHYGAIKTEENKYRDRVVLVFTFHYGAIKTKYFDFYLFVFPTLHSTMEQLKRQ